jgi:polyisoprenyl-phosphate glycosyltransferase
LIAAHHNHNKRVVFAARTRRADGLMFRLFYRLFQFAHWLLLGRTARIGNFSVIPFAMLDSLTVIPELWSHYAAAVVKSKVPHALVPLARSRRLSGESRMGFVSLVIHGLSAISVYGDVLATRFLIASSVLTALSATAIGAVLVVRFGTGLAIPGWATSAVGLMLGIMLQTVMISLVFAFGVLYSRSGPAFIPFRDCPLFLGKVWNVYEMKREMKSNAARA